jgi:hypothetical protein
MVTPPAVVVQVRSLRSAAWRGRTAQAKSASRAWSDFMMPQPYHTSGGTGSSTGFPHQHPHLPPLQSAHLERARTLRWRLPLLSPQGSFGSPSFVRLRAATPVQSWGRTAQAKSARRAWSDLMMPQPYHSAGGRGSSPTHQGAATASSEEDPVLAEATMASF